MNAFGNQKTCSVGIVGGLGPETTAEFYLAIIRKFRKYCTSYPSIVIDNLSFPFYLEEEIIEKSSNEEKLLPFLKESLRRLEKAQVDFIVIPCNTVHIFIDELRKTCRIPIVSILDETLKVVKNKGFNKIGLLATTKTINSKLYETPLTENGIDVIVPSRNEQKTISKIIVNMLGNKSDEKDRKHVSKISHNLTKRGAQCILLGCTDLQLIQNKYETEVIDTTDVLVSATFNKLIDISKNTNFKGS